MPATTPVLDPVTKQIVLGIINAAVTIWAQRTGRPPGWIPTPEEWDELGELPTVAELKARASLKAEAQES